MRTETQRLPSAEAVARLLGTLLGKNVTAKPGSPVAPGPRTPMAVGLYGPDSGPPTAICFCDIPMACYSGAALSLIPAGVVQESVRSGRIDDTVFENFQEVLNVAASLLPPCAGSRISLRQVYQPAPSVPAPWLPALLRPKARIDMELSIAGYGTGRMAFLML